MSWVEYWRRYESNSNSSESECFPCSNANALRIECAEVWNRTANPHSHVSNRICLVNPSIVFWLCLGWDYEILADWCDKFGRLAQETKMSRSFLFSRHLISDLCAAKPYFQNPWFVSKVSTSYSAVYFLPMLLPFFGESCPVFWTAIWFQLNLYPIGDDVFGNWLVHIHCLFSSIPFYKITRLQW